MRALIHLRRRSTSLNDGDMGHTGVKYDEKARCLMMDRWGVQVMMNLGEQEATFDVPDGFRMVLASRADIAPKDGRMVVPSNSIAIVSCEE